MSPRFALSCGADDLAALGRLAAEWDSAIQTHLAESEDEVAEVARRFPEARDYTDDSHDMHEANRDYLAKVVAIYRRLAEKGADAEWFLIDPMSTAGELRAPEDMQAEVWRQVESRLTDA